MRIRKKTSCYFPIFLIRINGAVPKYNANKTTLNPHVQRNLSIADNRFKSKKGMVWYSMEFSPSRMENEFFFWNHIAQGLQRYSYSGFLFTKKVSPQERQ